MRGPVRAQERSVSHRRANPPSGCRRPGRARIFCDRPGPHRSKRHQFYIRPLFDAQDFGRGAQLGSRLGPGSIRGELWPGPWRGKRKDKGAGGPQGPCGLNADERRTERDFQSSNGRCQGPEAREARSGSSLAESCDATAQSLLAVKKNAKAAPDHARISLVARIGSPIWRRQRIFDFPPVVIPCPN